MMYIPIRNVKQEHPNGVFVEDSQEESSSVAHNSFGSMYVSVHSNVWAVP